VKIDFLQASAKKSIMFTLVAGGDKVMYYTLAEVGIAAQTYPENTPLNIYGACPETVNIIYRFVWNRNAIVALDKIAWYSDNYLLKVIKSEQVTLRIRRFEELARRKVTALKSLYNLDAKNTRARMSISGLVSYTPEMHHILNSYDDYMKSLYNDEQDVRYLNAQLDEWVHDMMGQTGYEGTFNSLVNCREPTIVFKQIDF